MWTCKILLTKPFRVLFVKIICAVAMFCGLWLSLLPKILVSHNRKKACWLPWGNNTFDAFAIKSYKEDSQVVVNSKIYVRQGSKMSAVLTSNHYQRSPLVQGSMAIVCKVAVEMSLTLKNTQHLDRLIELVKSVYGHLSCQRHLSLSHFWLMRLGFNLY